MPNNNNKKFMGKKEPWYAGTQLTARTPRRGYFTFLHHAAQIIEQSHNVRERIAFIRGSKLEHEVSTRLRHIRFVSKREVKKILGKRSVDCTWEDRFHALPHVVQQQLRALVKTIPNHRWSWKHWTLQFPKKW